MGSLKMQRIFSLKLVRNQERIYRLRMKICKNERYSKENLTLKDLVLEVLMLKQKSYLERHLTTDDIHPQFLRNMVKLM